MMSSTRGRTAGRVAIPFVAGGPVMVDDRSLTKISLLEPDGCPATVQARDGEIEFVRDGWFEVLLDVQWEQDNLAGTRFSHTKIPEEQPLHSEAISAEVLAQLSAGRQLLRGNTVFGPGGPSRIVLEVWQDSGRPSVVVTASLSIRELAVPWPQE